MSRFAYESTASDPRRKSDSGVVAVYVALLVPVLFIFAAIAVDISRWYLELQRMQRAADAAALAGAPFMPDSLVSGSKARVAAESTAVRNGYTVRAGDVQQGARASQIKVILHSDVSNSFASLIGVDTTSLTRSAVAEFTGPAPMGSPCNTFGNEPVAGVQGPPGSVLGTVDHDNNPATAEIVLPACDRTTNPPQFWAKVQGPNTGKIDGDRFGTRVCGTRGAGLPDNCTSASGAYSNTEFRRDGYFFLLRVGEDARGEDITFQVYDPAWVFSGPRCENLNDPGTTWPNDLNDYTTDARTRYDNSQNPFCNGDYDPVSGGPPRSAGRLDTTFIVREPIDSLNPLDAPVINTCTTQFRGYGSAPTRNQLQKGATGYLDDLAKVFHQWYTICSIDDAKAGDYYVQVRTNRKLPDGGTQAIWSGAGAQANATTLGVDDPDAVGRGSNSFAMRAFVAGKPSASGAISVAGQERMPIFMNATAGDATFNLIRVTPGAAGSTIRFTVYDVGDAASSGTVTVLPPVEANLPLAQQPAAPNRYLNGFVGGSGTFAGQQTVAGCSSSNVNPGTNLTNCTVGISNTVNNGRIQEMTVPVPTNYNCNALSGGGCWFRLRVRFATGTVNDITTWTAVLDGDPVRLEE